MSYEQFYGLTERPFSISPDPKFFYESKQHIHALLKIKDAVDSSKGLSVIIGDAGLGKTFLSRKLLDKFQDEEAKYDASLFIVIHHEITVGWLLKTIAIQLGVEAPVEDKSGLISQICRRLLEIDQESKKAVIIIDEAHMLQTKAIYEELRGLLNVEYENHKLLNIILFGPADLDQYMSLDLPLVSRIGLKITLKPLEENEIKGYIQQRLKVVGCTNEIFENTAYKIIYDYSRGIPRLINTVCENSLLEGFLNKETVISSATVERAAQDLGLNKQEIPKEISEKLAKEAEKVEVKEAKKEKKSRISYV